MVGLSLATFTTDMNPALALTIYAVLMAGHFAAEPARWRLLFRDNCGWSFAKWFHLHNVTALLSYLLPAKLGVPLRIGLLRQQTQLPMNTVLAGLGLDAVINYGTWALVAAALAVGSPALRERFTSKNSLLLLAVIPLAAVIGLSIRRSGKKDQAADGDRSGANLGGLQGALRAVSQLPAHRLALILSVVLADVLAEGLRQACLAAGLGISVPLSTMMMIGIIGFAAGLFSFMPMGLGAYDAVVILLLSGTGVQPAQLVGLLAGNRLALIVFSGVLGSIGAVRLGFHPRQLRAFRDLVLRRKQAAQPDQTES